MKKVKKTYTLNHKTVERIEQIAIEKNMTRTNAIEYMIESYFENRSEEHQALMNSIEERLNKILDERVAEDLKRTRVIANVIDNNTQMMMEFWNHYFLVNDFKELGTTEKYKAEELKVAEQLVKKRIAERRRLKFEKRK